MPNNELNKQESNEVVDINNSIYQRGCNNFTDNGKYVKCSCPNHKAHKKGDSTPSFVSYKNQSIGWCFSCGFKISHLDYALKYLKLKPSQIGAKYEMRYAASIIGEEVFKWAKSSLVSSSDDNLVRRYLNFRGVSSEFIEFLDLGIAGDFKELEIEIKKHGIKQSVIDQSIDYIKKIVRPGRLLSFFFHPEEGYLTGANVRAIHSEISFERNKKKQQQIDGYSTFKKYERMNCNIYDKVSSFYTKDGNLISRAGKGAFGVIDLLKNKTSTPESSLKEVVIAEGEFDVIIPKVRYLEKQNKLGIPLLDANQMYGINMVALGSTDSAQTMSAVRNITSKIIFAMDQDDAGIRAIGKISKEIKDRHLSYVELGEGYKDVDDYVSALGYDSFVNLLSKSTPVINLYLKNIDKAFSGLDSKYGEPGEEYELLEAKRNEFARICSEISNESTRHDIVRKYLDDLEYKNDTIINGMINRIIIESKSGGKIDSQIREIGGETYVVVGVKKGGGENLRKISNFVMYIVNNIHCSNGELKREIYLENGYKERSINMEVSSSDLCSSQKFRKVCMNVGKFTFSGTDGDLAKFIESKMAFSNSKVITSVDNVGYIKESNLFIFGDCVIEDGSIYPKTENSKIIWTRDHKGIMIEDHGEKLPQLPTFLNDEYTYDKHSGALNKEGIDKILKKSPKIIHETLNGGDKTGRSFDGLLALGWAIGCFYEEDIAEEFEGYPFLFLGGKTLSGKSSFAKIIMSVFGMDTKSGADMSQTTMAAIHRTGEFYCSIPTWLEEYSNNSSKGDEFSLYLKSRYSKQGVVKASMKSTTGVVSMESNAPILFSGEHLPTDEAVRSRCLIINCSEEKRTKDFDLYNATREYSKMFRAIGLMTALGKSEKNTKKLLKNINIKTNEFLKIGVPVRIAKTYAICIESYKMMFDYNSDVMERQVTDELRVRAVKITEESDVLSSFFADLGTLSRSGKILKDTIAVNIVNKTVSIKFDEVVGVWMESRRRSGKKQFSEEDILGYLNEKSYLVRSKFGELRYRQSFLDITSKNSSSNPQKSNDNYGIMISTSDAGSIPTGVEKMLLDIKTSSVVDMLIEKK